MYHDYVMNFCHVQNVQCTTKIKQIMTAEELDTSPQLFYIVFYLLVICDSIVADLVGVCYWLY